MSFFGWFGVPPLPVPGGEASEDLLEETHEILGNVLLVPRRHPRPGGTEAPLHRPGRRPAADDAGLAPLARLAAGQPGRAARSASCRRSAPQSRRPRRPPRRSTGCRPGGLNQRPGLAAAAHGREDVGHGDARQVTPRHQRLLLGRTDQARRLEIARSRDRGSGPECRSRWRWSRVVQRELPLRNARPTRYMTFSAMRSRSPLEIRGSCLPMRRAAGFCT